MTAPLAMSLVDTTTAVRDTNHCLFSMKTIIQVWVDGKSSCRTLDMHQTPMKTLEHMLDEDSEIVTSCR